MTQQEALALVKRWGNKSKAAQMNGIDRTTFRRVLKGKPNRVGEISRLAPVASYTPTLEARSLSDFRNTYDLNTIVPRKIAAGFKQLGAGWLYEAEFAKLAGLTLKDLGMFRDNYSEHVVVVSDSRRVWTGNKNIAEEMRRML